MKWPWVSRRALDQANAEIQRLLEREQHMVPRQMYEVARSEVEWLREQNRSLSDQFTRIQRHEAGLPEVPRPPRPVLEPMPERLRAYLEGWGNASLRRDLKAQLYRRHANGTPWDVIEREQIPSEEEVEL